MEDSFQFFAGTFAVPEEQVEPITEVTQPDEAEDQLEDSALLKVNWGVNSVQFRDIHCCLYKLLAM